MRYNEKENWLASITNAIESGHLNKLIEVGLKSGNTILGIYITIECNIIGYRKEFINILTLRSCNNKSVIDIPETEIEYIGRTPTKKGMKKL